MNEIAPRKALSPARLLRAVRRRKLYLVIPIVLLVPAAAFYASRMSPTFKARVLVGTVPPNEGSASFTGRAGAAPTITAQEQLRAVRETLFADAVLETVNHELRMTPARKPEDLKPRIQVQVDTPEAFYIGFEAETPSQAVAGANLLAALFVERTTKLQGERMEKADNFLDEEVDRLRGELTQQEEALKIYRQSLAEVLPERLATNLKQIETQQAQIQAKTDQITEADARRATLLDELRSLETQGVLEPAPEEKSPTEATLDQLNLTLKTLRTKYTPEHPEIKRIEQEIESHRSSRTVAEPVRRPPSPTKLRYFSLQAEFKSVEPRLESYRREREKLLLGLTATERRVNSTPRFETGLAERMRDVAITRSRFEAMFAKQQEAKLIMRAEKTDSGGPLFKILEPAQLPKRPAGLPPNRVILFSLVGSFAIGLFAILFADRMDSSFETIDEFEEFSNLSVLSTIPAIANDKPRIRIPVKNLVKNKDGRRSNYPDQEAGDAFTPEQRRGFHQHRISVVSDPHAIASQQYGVLALKVRKWMEETGSRTLAVTSATGQEGKSTTALNLSMALAASDEGRVLLVDCDLRLPQVHQRLGLNPPRGFGELLAEDPALFAPYITSVSNLDVICGGERPENPLGLLASRRARGVLARLRQQYDCIILDTPPIIPIADTHILAGLTDGVLLVIRARRTGAQLFQRAVESLGANNVIGVVLNDVSYAGTPYAYAYKHYERHYAVRS